MTQRPITYIAGPYSANPTHCTTAAARFATALFEQTKYVPLVPHLSHHWDAVEPRPYQFWLDLDLELLRGCDAILRLPGASSGADGEMDRAVEVGLEVVDFEGLDRQVRNVYWANIPAEVKL